MTCGLAIALTAGCSSTFDFLAGRDSGPQVAKVVVLVPEDGPVAASGAGVHAAVTLALADLDVGDWDVVVELVDDGTADDDPLASVAEIADEIASDRQVIAVVGGLTPDAVRGSQRPLDEHGIAFVSPADDDPANTRGADPSAPQRPYESYYRTAIPERDPLVAAAQFAVRGSGATIVLAVHNGQPSEAAGVARAATAMGVEAKLVRAAELADVVSAIEAGDDVVAFVLVDDALAADVMAAAAHARAPAVVIGGAGLVSSATGDTDGLVAIVPGTLPAAPSATVPGLVNAGQFGPAAFDAGQAIAQMLERCLPAAQGSARDARHGCVSEMDTVSTPGASAHVSFDEYGDRPGTWPTIQIRTTDGWVDVAES